MASWNARRNPVCMRLAAMVMAVTVFLYGDVYIAAVDAAHNADSLTLLLPVSFALAVMLYAIFRFHPPSDESVPS